MKFDGGSSQRRKKPAGKATDSMNGNRRPVGVLVIGEEIVLCEIPAAVVPSSRQERSARMGT
jgi:hypothetical protein